MCSYVKLDNRKEKKWGTCGKCGASFVLHYGGKSQRMPCRVHEWDKNNKCIICYQNRNNYSGNCYHVIETPCCLGMCSIV